MGVSQPCPSIPGRFRETALRRGDAVCVYSDAGHWSFRALDRASDGLAAALVDQGLAPGDRLGLLCPNGADFILAYLGILKAGATVVPLNLLLNPKEVAFILGDSDAKGLIYHQAFSAMAAAALEAQPGVALRVCVGDAPGTEVLGFGELAAHPGPAPELDLDAAQAVAAVLYTSGTTGRPKGAMLTHANLLANASSVARALDFRDDDRVLVVLPMFHAFAATVGMLTPLLHGFGLVPVERFEPKLVSQTIAAQGATVFLGVPSMFAVLLRLDAALVSAWRTLRCCVSGGAAMPEAVMAAFEERFGVPVLEGDGPTECGPVTCVNPLSGPRKPGSVGLPVPDVEMTIRDAAGALLGVGETGEVCVRGPSIMKGYLNLPEATAASFFEDWFRTGDLGCQDAEGYFYLVDRLKDLIITNGMNVYPRVLEEVLYRHPDVAEAAVVGDPDARHGEVPVAYVTLHPGSTATPATLRAYCREHLGKHEIPRRVLIRETLPKSSTGKILKRELRRSGELERGVPLPSAILSSPPPRQ
ncbi:long-chain fatty acid--CoA ligase [Thiorhodococcus mannitoliphagus]|uniref:Long-chain fatty acid--CoA ligase n=1 Tax=Thiorhodococcus mannitoliphagus TaxID=329406 RepID=A0A6P1DWK7_9GAMM|nr:long-chain fatty acid--CoA ligase [Thiorhodococcus mannitoliphagus]NEX20035.1 long-chain fatty acid--CoA ligase [Thiorhodococcus mannitoliphagus]